jgi:hypothetical protein
MSLEFEHGCAARPSQAEGCVDESTFPIPICRKFEPHNYRKLAFRTHCGCQVMSTRTGIWFLTGIVKSDGGSILKSASVAGIVPVR